MERLRQEREALRAERAQITAEVRGIEPSYSVEEMRLHIRLVELQAKLKGYGMVKNVPPPPQGPPAPAAAAPPPASVATPISSPPPGAEVGKPSDPFTLAQALFRAGEYQAALQNYRRIDLESLTPQEKMFIQYMTACCLRKLGKLEDAAALYREVANTREDEVLTDCALWHLNVLNGRRETAKQLEELRQRREALK
jgi:tetratricopeptide (TPR) repeat protein